ncbi:VOC family protein [bacterium]|nr:MAG: VOC family protein [bacterium]
MSTKIVPHLTCRNAHEAYEFYQKAFGAQPMGVMNTPDGKVMHAALSIDGSEIYMHEEFPDWNAKSPETLGGTPVTVHLHVDDCDAVFSRAVEAGCTVSMPLEEAFWGDRYGVITDPYGHKWSIATTVREMSPEEMQKGMDEMFKNEAAA